MPSTKKSTSDKKNTQPQEKLSFDALVFPVVNSTNSIVNMKKIPGTQMGDVFTRLKTTNQQIADGNLQHLEDMLINQAHTLESIFYSCTEKMVCGQYINQIKIYSEIALKAQKQCRNTLTVIAELKNPKQTTFVKQQNNATTQQVNNSENNLIPSNEVLLEVKHDLDTRTTITPITAHPPLAALDEIDRG